MSNSWGIAKGIQAFSSPFWQHKNHRAHVNQEQNRGSKPWSLLSEAAVAPSLCPHVLKTWLSPLVPLCLFIKLDSQDLEQSFQEEWKSVLTKDGTYDSYLAHNHYYLSHKWYWNSRNLWVNRTLSLLLNLKAIGYSHSP